MYDITAAPGNDDDFHTRLLHQLHSQTITNIKRLDFIATISESNKTIT